MKRIASLTAMAAAIMLVGIGKIEPLEQRTLLRDDEPVPMDHKSNKHNIPKTHPTRMTKRQERRQRGKR